MLSTRSGSTWSADGRRQTLVAAMPPFLFGMGIAVVGGTLLALGGPPHEVDLSGLSGAGFIAGMVVGLLPVVVLFVGGVLATARRLPAWGYTWVGAALTGVFLVLVLVGDEREFLISPAADFVVVVLVLLTGLVAVGAAALRGWREAGLVSMGYSATLGLSLCFWVVASPFERYDLALLGAPLGLLVAALITVYINGSDAARVAALLGVGVVDAGLTWMAQQVWQPWFNIHGGPSPIAALLAILIGLLMVGPVLSLLGRPLRRAWAHMR